MGKHVRMAVLAILMFGLTALPASAGIITIQPPGGFSVAFEALPTATGATFTLANLLFNNFQFVNVANVIEVKLAQGTGTTGQPTFLAGTYLLCNATTGTAIAQFNVPAGTSDVNFQVTAEVAPGAGIQVTSAAACAIGNLPFAFHPGTNPTNTTVQITQFGVSNIVLDQATAVTLITVQNEYSASVAASTHFIDVLAGTGATFTAQTGTSPTGVLGASPVVMADSGQGTNLASPATIAISVANLTNPVSSFPGLLANAVVTIADPQKFQGVTKVFIAAGGTHCDSTASAPSPANLVQSSGTIAGQSSVTLTLPSQANGGFDQTTAATVSPGKLFNLCVLVNGNEFLNPRTITASVDINVFTSPASACCNDPAPTGAQPAQIWQLTGGDIRVSGVRADAATNNNTLFNLNNLGPTDGPIVLLQVFRTQTVSTQATPACTLNTAQVGVTLHGNGGHQLTAQDINAACLSQAADLNTIVYAVRMVLGIAPGNLSANAFRQFPTGVFLELPVLKLGNAFPNE